jgi:hypothetical protein
MKFLIDECLTLELVQIAIDRGYGESTRLTWRGRGGAKDWELLPFIVEGDWTFVTCNSADFRGPKHKRGRKGRYMRAGIHAGLVCLNGPADGTDLDLQCELFRRALDELEANPDLVNQVLEVTVEAEGGAPLIERYPMPAER